MDRKEQHGKGLKASIRDAEVIYGANPVKEILKAGRREIKCIYLLENRRDLIKEIQNLSRNFRVKIIHADRATLDRVCSTSLHQGIAAVVAPYTFSHVDSLISNCKHKKNSLLLMLDEITDPMNFGSIIRSSLLFGVDGIIVQEKHSCPVSAVVCRASAGAVEHTDIVRTVNLVNTVKKLKEDGFWIYGAESTASDSFSNIDFSEKAVIVMGSEGKGISRLLRENCDVLIKIPTTGIIDSLNVSVATGIILFNCFMKVKSTSSLSN